MKRGSILLILMGVMMIFAGCGEKGTIKIASKPMTEQYILTEIIAQLIEEETDYEVEITKGVGGGTTNIHPALVKGDFDLYPEYTRTAWLNVLKKEVMEKDDDALYAQLQEEYGEMGLTWTGLYGFSNTYGLAVREETAKQYGLSTYSDLAAASGELVFGGNPDYIELETGFPRLCAAYGMNFKDMAQMEIALKYEALKNGEVDVINAFTTDAQLAANNLVLLTDDNVFFETFDAGTVVRKDALEKYPKLQGVLEKLNGLISEAEMQQMNYEVEVDGKEDKEVAREFLEKKGLVNR
ncbi:MAG: glycine/betaine ABC transporter substrate-binding protein [Lachnospiraceae bacterium]|jgi:glycine betaine/choline ABC-type transport system substrate-binding protein|nr:glycine/betaine ABC transporter substrate-binding protein [Lachnospiraceae bacterium]MCI9109822.1 glycine/betaine ABC transporter substrate-binding protein [Lachnospiraceae bacterium]MCI9343221.1 glycine/betaine ABC transporter substrate-binding protein [Lachnospiraceae bacterium]